MTHRASLVAAGGIAVAAAIAVFAFLSMGTVSTAHAEGGHGIQNLSCSVNPSPPTADTPETLTCTFDFQGTTHTFVADFMLSSTMPRLSVSSCTLDGNPVHIGPCP